MEYAWIITLAWNASNGAAVHASRSGTCAIQPGVARNSAYTEILANVRASLGPNAANASTMYFSLEPNQLFPAGPTSTTLSDRQRPGER